MKLIKKNKYFFLVITISLNTQSCTGSIDPNSIKNETINSTNLLIGATLNYHELNTIKEELFLKDFKYLTPANAAKQSKVHPDDLSPKNHTMTTMRFPVNLGLRRSQHEEETVYRRADYWGDQVA